MKIKLIKLSDTHYIVVGENPDKMYEGWYELDNKIFNTSKYMLQNGCRVITHSTQPLEQYYGSTDGTIPFVYHKIKPLSLSEVEEVINGYSVDKMAIESADKNSRITSDHWMGVRTGYHLGFKAHQELSKDKLFTLDDIRIAILKGRIRVDNIQPKYSIEEIIQSLLPTEWDVEFVNGKIKLV